MFAVTKSEVRLKLLRPRLKGVTQPAIFWLLNNLLEIMELMSKPCPSKL